MQVSLTPTKATQNLIDKLGNSSSIVRGAKHKGLTLASMIFQTRSKEKSPIDTGNLRRNIKYKVQADGNQAKVYTDPSIKYALFQEEGTGLFGPRHSYIYPKRGRYLVWKAKSGKLVFATKVKGVQARWFMRSGSEYLQKNNKKVSDTIYNELVKGLQ